MNAGAPEWAAVTTPQHSSLAAPDLCSHLPNQTREEESS